MKTAVLIDDNDTVNFYNQDLLEDLNLFDKIIVLQSGKEAIDYFNQLEEQNTPSIVFMDIKMPDYTGFEVLEEVEDMDKEYLLEIPTYILTTSKHKRDLEAFERYPMAIGYIEKPLQEEQLQDICDLHL